MNKFPGAPHMVCFVLLTSCFTSLAMATGAETTTRNDVTPPAIPARTLETHAVTATAKIALKFFFSISQFLKSGKKGSQSANRKKRSVFAREEFVCRCVSK
jgi:hypothetical protein